ncbi:hypothetical protein KFK09_006837 [Dendrobium nobile]|uniref:Uncharacterized protein n=1 Tax=Dendrobium nobile TaxID=94219 RepID=A0A8T3BUQ1_DENNO|nr:hypothetical protein KFK09_006837 [Dendrobium nobile]
MFDALRFYNSVSHFRLRYILHECLIFKPIPKKGKILIPSLPRIHCFEITPISFLLKACQKTKTNKKHLHCSYVSFIKICFRLEALIKIYLFYSSGITWALKADLFHSYSSFPLT